MASLLDFNDTEPNQPSSRQQWDADDLSRRLGERAAEWAPTLFPFGKISADRSELRLADITGRRPGKQGSCVIQLKGDHAGSWNDFELSEGGGPLSTLKEATGLSGIELFKKAEELIGLSPQSTPKPYTNGHSPNAAAGEIANILAHSQPTAGTPVEAYLRSRRLQLPTAAIQDIRYAPNLTDWKTKTGFPAMVCVVRGPTGEPTGGIHRTYLKDDGSGKAEVEKPRMALGPIEGGAVHLAPGGEHLGVAEGVETAIAAMLLNPGVPVWAALSTSGLKNFQIPSITKELTIFADRGDAGEGAARTLADKATMAGIKATIRLPQSDDDFNSDLFIDDISQPHEIETTILALPEKLTKDQIEQLVTTLTPDSKSEDIIGVIRSLVIGAYESMFERQMLIDIKRQTKLPVGTLDGVLKEVKGELGLSTKSVRPRPTHAPGWYEKMIFTDGGEPKPMLANAITIFRMDKAWRDSLSFNEFTLNVHMRRAPPWHSERAYKPRAWTDNDTLSAAEWMQRIGLHIEPTVAGQAVEVVAREKSFHPVLEYLNGLAWDGVGRLDKWLTYYLGVDDSNYARAVGARWMISAAARIYEPGIKADCCLILRGEQGIKKSTALGILGDPWFTDDLADLGSKDSAMQTAGVWIIEIAELDSMSRAEVNKIKAFMSRRVDRFRPPYGRHVIEAPRQCVFAGSVNESAFLRDATGARRFWPVLCRSIDTETLYKDRDQLWAEAVHRYKKGDVFWLDDVSLVAEARKHQADHYQHDSWEELVVPWLDRKLDLTEIKISEIMTGPLQLKPNQWSRLEQKRVEDILHVSGYERQASGGWKKKV